MILSTCSALICLEFCSIVKFTIDLVVQYMAKYVLWRSFAGQMCAGRGHV